MFDTNYDVFLCDTVESKFIHFNTRYQVYCLETQFENPDHFPDAMEIDDYDDRSAHFVVRCKSTGKWVAAARLVIDKPDRLPFWHKCKVENESRFSAVPVAAEISRMCIVRDVRKSVMKPAKTEIDTDSNVVSIVPRRREPEILVGLLRALYQFSRAEGIHSWFAMQSIPLARIVKSLGFTLCEIGPEVDYRGIRKPYHCEVSEFASRLPLESKALAYLFAQRGYGHYSSASIETLDRAAVS